MNKPLMIISSPFDCYAGYGARSRDVIKELIKSDKYNVRLLPQGWGSTPWGFCKANPDWEYLLDYVLRENEMQTRPDIWIQITIPNEFKPIGKLNIGMTAGIETDVCAPSWLEGINRMDLNIVSSEHAKKVFQQSVYNKRDSNGNESVIKSEKPIKVLFEGIDSTLYKSQDSSTFNLDDIEEEFGFLFVGHWMNGVLGEDRKNVGLTIKTFYDAFKNSQNQPALILKTAAMGGSHLNKYEIMKRMEGIKSLYSENDKLPNVYLINGDVSDKDMNELYNHPKVKAMVSLTKGEGFGRPLLEFSFTGKPIMTTLWSGQVDFLKADNILSIKGTLTNTHPSAVNDWIIKEGRWFSVGEEDAINAYRVMFKNYKKYLTKASSQKEHVLQNFTIEKMGEKLIEIIDKEYSKIPAYQELVLPAKK